VAMMNKIKRKRVVFIADFNYDLREEREGIIYIKKRKK
jgi:hypothetical protein